MGKGKRKVMGRERERERERERSNALNMGQYLIIIQDTGNLKKNQLLQNAAIRKEFPQSVHLHN